MDRDGVAAREQVVAAAAAEQVGTFLAPLLTRLDLVLDRRLVQTALRAVVAIVCWRNRAHGLLLSELGGYITSPAQAPAGTKRLSNLLRSAKWTGRAIAQYLWEQADAVVARQAAAGQPVYAAWDESVLEKAESAATPDLTPVRSSRAGRLAKSKVGYFQRLERPLMVRGLHWLGLLVVAPGQPPTLANLRWWGSRREEQGAARRQQLQALLVGVAGRWGQSVLHLFDRGYATTYWLESCRFYQLRFVLRWPGRHYLYDAAGQERPAWQLARGKRAWGQRQLWDGRRRCWRTVGVLAVRAGHASSAGPLWLVVARRGHGESPWYLLTTEPADTLEQAWAVVYAYAQRWTIELSWRYGKAELALESPRLWTLERREKLLLLASLAYAFLLALCVAPLQPLVQAILRRGCHRTGKRSRTGPTPLYRLRSALSRLWLAYPPQLSLLQCESLG
jgi:hypothetical protein